MYHRRPILGWAAAGFALALLVPAVALGAGSGLSDESFQAILILLGVVSVAYIVTHFVSEWVARRFGVVTGIEYVVLGAFIGPVFGILREETLVQVAPALVLAEGSLGLLAGILLNFRNRTATSARSFGIGLTMSVATLGLVAGLPLAAIGYFLGPEEVVTYVPHALCAGAVASVASAGPIRSLIVFLDARGEGADVIIRTAQACSSIAVVAFGTIFCLFKSGSDLLPVLETGAWGSFAVWFGVHIAIGGTLGVIFSLFLIRDFEDEKILTVVIGMVIFTSGVAYYLKLSPIFVCFVLGLVLANICRQAEHVVRMLLSVERPLYIVLFFFFGASITFGVSWTVTGAICVAYLLLRAVGRVVGGLSANRLFKSTRNLPQVGPALLAPGALSAAMLLNFLQVFGEAPYAHELFVGLLVAIVVSEPVAYRFSRRWLIDATDVAMSSPSATLEEEATT